MKASAKYNAYGIVFIVLVIAGFIMKASDAMIAMVYIVAVVLFGTSDLLKALGK